MSKGSHSSATANKHPYMRASFWLKNQFWHDPARQKAQKLKDYSPETKAYYDEWLNRMVSSSAHTQEVANSLQTYRNK